MTLLEHEDLPPRTDLQRALALVVAVGGQDDSLWAQRVEGEPVAKARARIARRRAYTPQRTLDAEEAIASAFREARAWRFPSNVAVAVVFYRSNNHVVDTDNLLKTVLDGITKSEVVWADDSQVTALVAVTEYDPHWPRTAIAVAAHESTLLRGEATKTHTCATCGRRYKPHGAGPSIYCSRACRPRRVLVCVDCGGKTSAPHVKRCNACHRANQKAQARKAAL